MLPISPMATVASLNSLVRTDSAGRFFSEFNSLIEIFLLGGVLPFSGYQFLFVKANSLLA